MGREAMRDIPQSNALSAGELRSLQTLHEGLPAAFGAALSTLLRNPVEVGLPASINSVTANSCIAWKILPISAC